MWIAKFAKQNKTFNLMYVHTSQSSTFFLNLLSLRISVIKLTNPANILSHAFSIGTVHFSWLSNLIDANPKVH